jgi:squalene-associated FAD-dependent desaturase
MTGYGAAPGASGAGAPGRGTVAVVGGGLAGITAAIDLREAGWAVTLLEARPRLGGAASSYQRGDLTVDNGQHVILRCCAAYQELLGRLGAAGKVAFQPKFDVTVLAPGGRRARLARTGLPSPLHLTGSLLGYRMLPLRQRLGVARAALAMRFVDQADARLDDSALGPWLAAHGQGELARRVLWDLFVISALNIAGDEANLQLAAVVIKTALLGAKDAADIGVATVPLGELHGQAPARLLAELGAQVRMNAKVAAIRPVTGAGFELELASGEETLRADAVVLAVPSGPAVSLAAGAGVAGADRWEGLGASPIVNVHVIYDRPVIELPFVAAVESPVQWVFDKTRVAGLDTGQYLAVSVSAAGDYVNVPSAQLREAFLPELARLFPAAAKAQVIDSFVTRERRATFRQVPGCGALRPGAGTSVSGLVLAGSWTDTGWPDTMEGAVRSGHCAAQQLIEELAGQRGAVASGAVASGTVASGTVAVATGAAVTGAAAAGSVPTGPQSATSAQARTGVTP